MARYKPAFVSAESKAFSRELFRFMATNKLARPNLLNRLEDQLQPFGEEETEKFGIVPNFSKDELNGHVVLVLGCTQEYVGRYDTPARAMLFLLPDDELGEPWGFLYSVESPLMVKIMKQVERGKVPFVARVERVQSKANPNNFYWTLASPTVTVTEDGTKKYS